MKRIRTMSKEGRNEALIVKLIEEIREGGEELMSELTEDERTDLERIQYETYIKLDKYVEALENEGIFSEKDNVQVI